MSVGVTIGVGVTSGVVVMEGILVFGGASVTVGVSVGVTHPASTKMVISNLDVMRWEDMIYLLTLATDYLADVTDACAFIRYICYLSVAKELMTTICYIKMLQS
jgi:hypothetical protein